MPPYSIPQRGERLVDIGWAMLPRVALAVTRMILSCCRAHVCPRRYAAWQALRYERLRIGFRAVSVSQAFALLLRSEGFTGFLCWGCFKCCCLFVPSGDGEVNVRLSKVAKWHVRWQGLNKRTYRQKARSLVPSKSVARSLPARTSFYWTCNMASLQIFPSSSRMRRQLISEMHDKTWWAAADSSSDLRWRFPFCYTCMSNIALF